MLCLGIESTAHTFGVGIADDSSNKKILSNVKHTLTSASGGILPREAAEHHARVAARVIKKAVEDASVSFNDLDLIAFSAGPGLGQCLRIGEVVSKYLALRYDLPLVGINHCQAHIEIGLITTKVNDPVVLYVSGGNTQIIARIGTKYRVFGETLDIAIGNALDKFARAAGLEFPGGMKIEKLAKKGKYVELPYVVKGMDFSFSGMVTALERKLREGYRLEDLCFSFQEHAFAMLTEAVERAMAHTGKQEVLLTGGVAANKRLQNMLETMCKERMGKFFVVPKEYAGDNGAMIAWTGIVMAKNATRDVERVRIDPKLRIDDLEM